MIENLNQEKIKDLKLKANNIRKNIVEMLYLAKSGHTAGALGMADIFTLLYFHQLKHKSSEPNWPNRDRLILSNGHICPVLYATMAESGYFPIEDLKTLRKFGSKLQGHPHREFLTSLETSSGPLGEGLSQAVGMAIALKLDNKMVSSNKIYCLLGDGELDEGQNWEALMLAAKEKLSNLIIIIDRNNIQIDGNTERVMPLYDLAERFKSFNCLVQEIDGHDFEAINQAILKAQDNYGRPAIIIAQTIPGKGVKAWENDYHWHGVAPNQAQYEMAMEELNNA